MKILMVIPYLASSYGGTTKIVKELANSVGQCQVSVDVVTTNADYASILPVKTSQWIVQGSYRVQYFSAWHRSDLIWSLALAQWLTRHINEYDLVHTHTIFAPLISWTHGLCQLRKIPYISAPHGMLEPWALSYKSWKKNIYYTSLERNFLSKASAIQVTASPEGKNINFLGFDKLTLVPNGLNKEKYLSLKSPAIFYSRFPHLHNKKLILFLGRIDPKKGLDLLAPAFARVRKSFPDIHLVIAGPDRINFTPTAKGYFIEAHCLEATTFTGMLKGSLKYAALAAADLYVSPSYSEGFSMSILEGMAVGLPCIITQNCNFPEAQAAKAAYVVKTNTQAIADALLTCLQNPHQAKQLGHKAQNFIAQNYTWKQSAKKLLNTYTAILQGNALPNPIYLGESA
ncbi:MAG: glycosyltransferase [Cyanothece sp. SIO1E1]|nr:glycosyltransferase [Cyanothece sp. SIO1E1]